MCKNWGFERIAEVDYKESIDEMKHADELVERILFLDGLPNLQKLGKINVGETRPRAAEVSTSQLEMDAVAKLNQAIAPLRRREATTPRATSSRTSSRARKSTSTGWRRSSA